MLATVTHRFAWFSTWIVTMIRLLTEACLDPSTSGSNVPEMQAPKTLHRLSYDCVHTQPMNACPYLFQQSYPVERYDMGRWYEHLIHPFAPLVCDMR